MAEETPETPETEPTTAAVDTATEAPEESTADAVDAPAEAAAPAEPEVVLSPKERRIKRRAANAPAPSGPRTIEEREAARLERRQRNAKQRRAYRARLKTKRAERRADKPAETIEVAAEASVGRPKVRQGIVVSDKAAKTIVVRVDVARRHRRYGKIMRLHVHDEANDANTGDTVRVVESRPLSATKRWRLVDVLERAK